MWWNLNTSWSMLFNQILPWKSMFKFNHTVSSVSHRTSGYMKMLLLLLTLAYDGSSESSSIFVVVVWCSIGIDTADVDGGISAPLASFASIRIGNSTLVSSTTELAMPTSPPATSPILLIVDSPSVTISSPLATSPLLSLPSLTPPTLPPTLLPTRPLPSSWLLIIISPLLLLSCDGRPPTRCECKCDGGGEWCACSAAHWCKASPEPLCSGCAL